MSLHCKKELAVFPSPAWMSLIKLFLGGNNLVFSRPERVWSVTSWLGTVKWLTLFYSVYVCPLYATTLLYRYRNPILRMKVNLFIFLPFGIFCDIYAYLLIELIPQKLHDSYVIKRTRIPDAHGDCHSTGHQQGLPAAQGTANPYLLPANSFK